MKLSIESLWESIICTLAGLIHSREGLVRILRKITRNSMFIDKAESAIVEGTLKIYDMQVREIMIPRVKMTMVHYKSPLKKFLPKIIESAHSRFPVVNEEDKVIGILLAKDLLPYIKRSSDSLNLDRLMRPVIYIPESKRLNVLLQEFRSKRVHMAIVLDEHDMTAGLVTIEDVLEEIVGEIEDEHDKYKPPAPHIAQIPFNQNNYKIKADTPLEKFNDYFATNLKHGSVESIGGVVLDALQKVPAEGDSVTVQNICFKVSKVNERHIEELIAEKIKK